MVPPTLPSHVGFRRGAERLAYNEPAFRYFLSVDRARAQRSGRSLYLVLVTARQGTGRRAPFSDAAAAGVFRSLIVSVREVDFVGWFHERYVAGAVLVQASPANVDMAAAILKRIQPVLTRQSPQARPDELRVRVIRFGSRSERRS